MEIRKVFVPILEDVAFGVQLGAALQFARDPALSVNAVYIPSQTPYAGQPQATVSISDLVDDDDVSFEDAATDDNANEALARAKFQDWRAAHDLAPNHADKLGGGPRAKWRKSPYSLETEIVASGRLSDLIILNCPDAHEAAKQRAFDVAVFETGRPTLLVFDEIPDDMLRHVLIAWNGSLEATRAVTAAMPLLEKAGRVSIFSATEHVGTPTAHLDLGELLIRHGIQSHKLQAVPGEPSIGAALLKVAAYNGVTMLVMGAYTHSRVREMLLGGVTQHVIRHATIPVLMMH